MTHNDFVDFIDNSTKKQSWLPLVFVCVCDLFVCLLSNSVCLSLPLDGNSFVPFCVTLSFAEGHIGMEWPKHL